jgi:hypothetical protein
MSDQPRDWDKELAKIDRAMARVPEPAAPPAGPAAAPARAAAAPGGAPGPGLAPEHTGPRATATTWLRVLLVVTLALAMPLWPYPKGCGVGLFAYLAAASIVVLAGVWASVSTWHRRRPIGHILAILVLLWGIALVAAEVLPRVGYARTGIRWTCG